jgi:hypothetical protein
VVIGVVMRQAVASPMDSLHQAARLYLDTAGLYDLGDGKRPGLLDRICGAMNAAGAVLVVGPAHMLDLHRRADAATRERFFAFLDQFPRVATIHSSPPISHDRQTLDAFLTAGRDKNPGNDLPDLVLGTAVGGVRASFAEGGYSEAEWTTAAMEGESLSVETSGFGAGQGEKLPREAQRILEETFAMATRGEDAAAWMMD